MKIKGKAHPSVPFSTLSVSGKSVVVLDEVSWPSLKISLTDVLMGDEESIQIDRTGELVGGVVNLLKFKALNPEAQSIEVSVVGQSELPFLTNVLVAA